MGLDHLLDLLQKSPASFPHKSVYNTSTKFNKYISMIRDVHASQAWCRSTYLIHIWIPSFFSDSLGAEDLAHPGTTGTSIPELVSSSGAWWSKVSDFWGYPMQNWENQAWLSVIIIIYQPFSWSHGHLVYVSPNKKWQSARPLPPWMTGTCTIHW